MADPKKAPVQHHDPYISPDRIIPELTLRAVLMGAVLGVLFAASSVYLALKVGMTVSASIPIAVLSITLFRLFTKATILENNIVQTTGSAGESIAAGVVFTMPAILLMGYDLKASWVLTLALIGGALGVLMMIPLRRGLIVEEHGKLAYPEGTACAQVLIVGEQGGTRAAMVFAGLGLGALYKFLYAGLKFWKEIPQKVFQGYPGASISGELSPELMGVGYIIGPRVASIMWAGGLLSYMVLIPAIKIFGGGLPEPLFPAQDLIANMTPKDIRSAYVLYIGAGAVAASGIMSMIASLPTIAKAFRAGVKNIGLGRSGEPHLLRTERDLPITVVLFGSLLLVAVMVFTPGLHVTAVTGVFIILFGFFFVTVSSRICGEIGSSANPISGMTVATLLMTCLIFVLLGWGGADHRVMALSIGAIVCIAASNGGNTSQDLKTGFLVGATPRNQQISLMAGVVASALVIGFTLLLLNDTYVTQVPVNYPGFTAPSSALAEESMRGTDGRTYRVAYLHDPSLPVPVGKYLADGAGALMFRVDPGIAGTAPSEYKKTARPGITLPPGAGQPALGPDRSEYLRIVVSQGKAGGLTASAPDGVYLADSAGAVKFEEVAVTKFDAPQARLMNMIIDGILTRKLPWGFVLIGVFIAVVMRLVGISPLPFAVGAYLPVSTSTPIFIGGVIRWWVDRKRHEEGPAAEFSPGTLLASGYIAGGALCGLLVAGLTSAGWSGAIDFSTPLGAFAQSDLVPCITFAALGAVLLLVATRAKSPSAG